MALRLRKRGFRLMVWKWTRRFHAHYKRKKLFSVDRFLFEKKLYFCTHFKKSFFINKKQKNMLNQYETVFIMTPVLSEDQMKETVKKFENYLTEKGAEIVHQENWGLKKLCYPIAKKTSGFYHLFEFKADGSIIKDFELQYRRDERVIRYQTVLMDKHAIAFSERRRNLKKNTDKKKRSTNPWHNNQISNT